MNINTQTTSNLIEELSKFKGDERVESFVRKYKTWFAFFEEILKTPEDTVLPKLHALVATSKIIVLTGLAEDLGTGGSFVAQFNNFLNHLNTVEKLFFSLIFEVKASRNKEADDLYQEYLKTGDDGVVDKLMAISAKDDDIHQVEITDIMNSFLTDDTEKLDAFFKKRADLLYGVRSKIVHNGSPDVIGAMLSSDMEVIMYYGEKENKFFTFKYPIEEFFVRAAYRVTGHEPQKIIIKDFLWANFISQQAPRVARIVNKIEKSDNTV